MKTFGCSKYKIDQARKFNSLNTGIKLPQTNPKTRIYMDIGKAEHFLDFLFPQAFYRTLHMEQLE